MRFVYSRAGVLVAGLTPSDHRARKNELARANEDLKGSPMRATNQPLQIRTWQPGRYPNGDVMGYWNGALASMDKSRDAGASPVGNEGPTITRTYLITGGAGFLGSHLVDALVARGDRAVILDDLSTGTASNLEAALRSESAELVPRADVCVHMAAAVGVELVLGRPLDTLLSNVRGADVVLAAAARDRKPLLYASTSELYGKLNSGAIREDATRELGSPFTSRWSYAIAKEFGEAAVHGYARDAGCEMAAVRLFNAVGPRQSAEHGMVLPRFVSQALAGAPLTVYGDGSQTRCFTDVRDVTRALIGLLDSGAPWGRVFNVGSDRPTSVLHLARRVIALTGSASEIEFVPYERAYPNGHEELGNRVPDTGALRRLTGWAPIHSIEKTIAWMVPARAVEFAA
jgi:nucleoside-diphosphate-sugar epimerase